MKKITFLTIALLLSVCLFAQHSMMSLSKNKAMVTTKAKLPGTSGTKAIIWQDDFSVPANWTITNDVGNSDDWVIGTGVPSGTYAIDGIASTTAANGFALFDSDVLCSGNQIANVSTASSINCTGHTNVQLQFEEMYRRYVDSTFVYVSTDGSTWTKFPVNATYADNDMTPNPTTVGVNISSVAGNQASVWIRFTFYSPSSMGTSAGCGYAWMIDDVKLQDLVAYDAACNSTFLDFDQFSYYEAIPFSQMGVISYGCSATNNGSSALTNVTFNVNINNSAITATSTPIASMASGVTDTLLALPTFTTPTTLTNYGAKLWLTQTETDADPANNIGDSISFYATPTEYQRSLNLNQYLTPYSFSSPIVASTGTEYGCNYLFPSADEIDSIEVLVYKATAGTSITGKLYTADMATADRTLVGQSAVYNLTPGSLPSIIKLPLTAPYNVASGTILTATVSLTVDIANNDTIGIGADGDFIGDASIGGAAYLNNAGTWGWYYVSGTVPIVGLVTKTGTGVNDNYFVNGIKLFQNQPNPATNATLIQYEIQNNASVSLEIYDVTGRLVLSYDEGKQIAGKHNILVDSDKLNRGTYYYSLKADNHRLTKKMIITQ
ncbi:MAG: T9SS type A sorting domain-containing protein [Bacteroidales bacterium]